MASQRRSQRTKSPVERLRAICLALPDTTEKVAWGEPTWRVRGRLFAQLDNHHHGAEHLAVWLPAPLGEQESMIFLNPVRFSRRLTWASAAGLACASTGDPTGR